MGEAVVEACPLALVDCVLLWEWLGLLLLLPLPVEEVEKEGRGVAVAQALGDLLKEGVPEALAL